MSDLPRILFITVGDRSWASSRLRSYWPADIMPNAEAVQVTGKDDQYLSADFDAYVWMKTGDLEAMQQIRRGGKVQLVEVCDPNWWFQPDYTRALIDNVTAIAAATRAAERDLLEWYGRPLRSFHVPDRLNLGHYPIRAIHGPRSVPRIVWYGIAANRISLYAAMANLDRLYANGYRFTLTICDDEPQTPFGRVRYPLSHIRWELDRENEILAAHDIALLPPYPGPWGQLKSNNKKLTAWACGLPTTDAQDYNELVTIVTDWQYRRDHAAAGYDILAAEYQTEHTAAQWNKIIIELMKGADDVQI